MDELRNMTKSSITESRKGLCLLIRIFQRTMIQMSLRSEYLFLSSSESSQR
jgi:hypothetical protein